MKEGPIPAQGQHCGKRSKRRHPQTSKEKEVSEIGDGTPDDAKGKDTLTVATRATGDALEPRKMYACDECDKSYLRKGKLSSHKKKKHMCTPEDASQTSTTKEGMNQFDADGILEALNNSFIVESVKVVAEESGFESNGADDDDKGKDSEAVTSAAGASGDTLESRKRKKSETEGAEAKKRKIVPEAVAEKPRVTTFNLTPASSCPPSPKPWRAISFPEYGEIN